MTYANVLTKTELEIIAVDVRTEFFCVTRMDMLCLNIWHLFPSVCKRSRFNIDCPVSQDVGIFVPKGRTNLFEIANRPHFFWQSRMYFSNRKGSNIGQRWWSVKLAFDQVTCTFSKVNFNRIMNPDRCTRGPISRCGSFLFIRFKHT